MERQQNPDAVADDHFEDAAEQQEDPATDDDTKHDLDDSADRKVCFSNAMRKPSDMHRVLSSSLGKKPSPVAKSIVETPKQGAASEVTVDGKVHVLKQQASSVAHAANSISWQVNAPRMQCQVTTSETVQMPGWELHVSQRNVESHLSLCR